MLIDKLCYSSKYRYKSPYIKSLFSIGTLLVCVFSRSIILSIFVLLIMWGLTVFGGGIPCGRYFKLMSIPLAFLLLSTIAIIVNISDIPLSWFAIPVGRSYITVSASGLLRGMQLILTALSAVSCLYFLTLTTPITDILLVLRTCRCPHIIIEMLLLIYRFIFVLMDLMLSIRRAQICRLGNKDMRTSLHAIGKLMAVLLVRAMQKSTRLYEAMESRCYHGALLVISEYTAATKRELAATLGWVIVLIAGAIFCSVHWS